MKRSCLRDVTWETHQTQDVSLMSLVETSIWVNPFYLKIYNEKKLFDLMQHSSCFTYIDIYIEITAILSQKQHLKIYNDKT